MTPTTFTKPATITAACTDNPTGLAGLPLQFTLERICKNKAVKVAIIDALADKSCSDQCIAAIFKNACLLDYQNEMNQLIGHINEHHGENTVQINDNVQRILYDDQIDVLRHGDGTFFLDHFGTAETNPQRHSLVSSTLENMLPTALCQLVADYDDEIAICLQNKEKILDILKHGDRAQKRSVIAAASYQQKIPCFNVIFRELGARVLFSRDLAHVDLSDLDLTDIDLSSTNLSFANLQNSCLHRARLRYAELTGAILNNASLVQADLSFSNLKRARLIGANLSSAILKKARGPWACLLCARLHEAVGLDLHHFFEATFNFSDVELSKEQSRILTSFPKPDAPLDVLVSPKLLYCDPAWPAKDWPHTDQRVVIDEIEKQLLWANRIRCHANADGTVQLRRALALYQDRHRLQTVGSTLTNILPKALTELISAYDQEIEISEKNQTSILDTLQSGTTAEKAAIIAAASHQSQIYFLSKCFEKLLSRGIKVDLTSVDLSHLNLGGLYLNHTNLSHAIMKGCNLFWASFTHANLTGTDLSGANLTHANLVRAHISQVRLTSVNLSHADLSGAVFEYVDLRSNPVLTETNWHEVKAKSITVDAGTRLQLPLQIARRCIESGDHVHFDR